MDSNFEWLKKISDKIQVLVSCDFYFSTECILELNVAKCLQQTYVCCRHYATLGQLPRSDDPIQRPGTQE